MKKLSNFYVILLLVFVCLIPLKGFCDGPGDSAVWRCRIIGERYLDSHTDTAFNSTAYDLLYQIPRNYLFPNYIDDTTKFTFQYNGSFYVAGLPAYSHNIKVYKDYSTSPIDSFINVPDSVPLKLAFHEKGFYRLQYYNYTSGAYDLWADITILPKIQHLWLEAPEICTSSYNIDSNYRFVLKTDPPIDSMMFSADNFAYSLSPSDYGSPEQHEKVSLSVTFSSDFWNYCCNTPVTVYDDAGVMTNFVQTRLRVGSAFPNGYPDTLDIEHFYIPFSELAPYLTSPYYHNILKVNYNDGIADYINDVPIIMKSGTLNPDPGDNIPDAGFHFYKDTIFETTIWTPTDNDVTSKLHLYNTDTIRIEDTLFIMPGASLTIHGMTVEFGPNGLVYVDKGNPSSNTPGAYLELDSTTFTWYHKCSGSNGSGDMWSGVVVSGNSNQYQAAGYQGKMVTKYSRIEYAQVAVSVGDIGLYDISGTGTGGILQANKTVFSNNRMASLIWPFHNINPYNNAESNNEVLYNACDFVVDNDLPVTFQRFILGADVKGIDLHGCSMVNNISNPSNSPFGTGIEGYDMGMWIDDLVQFPTQIPYHRQSVFNNLHCGVNLKSIQGTRSITARYNFFDRNTIGIWLEGVQVPVITYDTFKIPTFVPNWQNLYLAMVTTGYVQNTGSGYTVHNNRFERATPINGNYGVGANLSKTGSSPNMVNNNTYVNMQVGNLSNYKNTNGSLANPLGLQFRCNSHSSNAYDEAACGDDSTSQGMRGRQGEPTLSAGNSFSTSGINIYNPGSQVKPTTYYYLGTLPTVSGNVSLITASNENSCLQIIDSNANGPYGLVVRTYNTNGHLLAPKINDSTMDSPPAGTGLISRAQVYVNINYYLTDSAAAGHRDSLYYWVTEAQTAYTDLLLSDLVLADSSDSAGLYNAIYYIYDSIGKWYALDSLERKEFRQGRKLQMLKAALRLSGRGILQLDSAEQGLLQEVADSSSMWARVRAQNWLSLYTGEAYDYPVILPVDSTDTSSAKPGYIVYKPIGNVRNVQAAAGADVYPNPVHNRLYVDLGAGEGAALIVISDASGRQVKIQQLRAGGSSVELKGLAPGIYFYRVTGDGATLLQGKIAKD